MMVCYQHYASQNHERFRHSFGRVNAKSLNDSKLQVGWINDHWKYHTLGTYS